jgi:hypothetical protein
VVGELESVGHRQRRSTGRTRLPGGDR